MKLPKILSDKAILQRDRENTIWGQSSPGADIKVTVSGENDRADYHGKADDAGNFEVKIAPKAAGGPYTIEVCDLTGNEKLVINDVLFGDVFLLAGQSNMELTIRKTLDLTEEHMKHVNNPLIRHFEVSKEPVFGRKSEDLSGGAWLPATSEYVYDFSALGFFYAEHVLEDFGIPVGLVQTAVGGAHIEALMDEDRLKLINEKLKDMAVKRGEDISDCDCDENNSCKVCCERKIEADKDSEAVRMISETELKKQSEWCERLDAADRGLTEKWYEKTDLNEDGFINIPDLWEENPARYRELVDVRGAIWVYKSISLTAEQAAKKAKLFMGMTIDSDDTYINGVKIGHSDCRYDHARYDVPEGLLREGINTIFVRVVANGRCGGFVPQMPYFLRLGDEKLTLNGEWRYKIGHDLPKGAELLKDITFYIWRPCGLYNGMLYPLRHLNFKGMMFYQGESNAGHAWEYEFLLREFVDEMRELYNDDDLPFVYIQLPYWGQEGKGRHSASWEFLRDAQARAQDIKNATMVDIYDLGFEYELHPQNKMEVADRVYRQWKIYEQNTVG
ncbi:MAG: hypothetical protein K6G69_06685 [Lachnospiraceae bacterium]|nr:hypothetical protein [Lachnospiraceae bacterium]